MITLPKLVVSDADLTASAQTGATTGAADGAQDFFALLSGAMSGKTAAKDGPLSLADLQAVSQQLPQGEAKTTLSTLLAQQADDATQKVDVTAQADAQSVLSALTPEVKSDVVKQLAKDLTNGDDKPPLSEEEMAGLSALMAMLPHTTTVTAALPTSPANTAITTTNASSGKGFADFATTATPVGTALSGHDSGKALAQGLPTHGLHAVQTDDSPANQTSPLVAAAAAKADADSSLSAAAPAVNVAPVISNATATVNTHPVVTVNSQLGTPEWQQNVSQHITLFTRQGQQTAELKLHPENLGQVNITLKIEDNQAQIQMVSPHSHVRAALEAAIPTLRTQLADNGIQLSQSNVSSESFAGQQQQSSFGQHSSPRSSEGRAFPADDEEMLSVPASLQAQVRGNGTVDTFA
ncbi:flagellar hook length control protein FliK [Scandinavium sp. V105_16]|uniref:Flagellar hook length control protein FliK n=1 Tax=Scandinavium lactucae TaxID=3095028 RepID=A0AAJ2VTU1_9ENTR|nr:MULTISPECIES: flagellar hook length control protein FliK [unclassified Scandinavium]MDX6020002.1 flagellar hook length control protein FliK [Scandinavium sp. V105_16]MDX6031183.1 flagellar hook length control protein FliK [Scandinavium sp. V105_12]MDX6040359.1 flagellar hook length control protein FliK [Scandinavium sp. V105_6]MDX6050970.1 flagellar hook length control protein FliK [Scandinavium sp. V105_1]